MTATPSRTHDQVISRPVARSERTVQRQRQVSRWPGKKITYSEKLPPSWDWVVSRAARAWNKGSGVKIKFVKAPKGKRGQVLIKRANTGGYSGLGTLGRLPNAYVHMSNRLPKKLDRDDWVSTSVLMAHEFGHVLGLSHDPKNRPGNLMNQYTPAEVRLGDGTMSCRWVTKRDAKRAIGLYGGKVKLLPQTCLVEPVAAALKNAVATGGMDAGTPVSVNWTLPKLPPGSKIYVNVSVPGSCGSQQFGEFRNFYEISGSATSWTDPIANRFTDRLCYSFQAVNYWGGGKPAFTTTR